MLHLLEFKKGCELVEELTKEIEARGIKNAAIVSIIGAVDECCISNMPKEDALSDTLNEYREPLEMSGTGDITDGKPHIHCTMSREGETALAGHLHWAKIRNWFVRVYVHEF